MHNKSKNSVGMDTVKSMVESCGSNDVGEWVGSRIIVNRGWLSECWRCAIMRISQCQHARPVSGLDHVNLTVGLVTHPVNA